MMSEKLDSGDSPVDSIEAEISFDFVMDDDMPFVEGTYRLPGQAWEVVIFSRYDTIDEPVVRTARRWDSGVTWINVEWPRSMKLNRESVLRVLSETLGVTKCAEVRGPDSMELR